MTDNKLILKKLEQYKAKSIKRGNKILTPRIAKRIYSDIYFGINRGSILKIIPIDIYETSVLGDRTDYRIRNYSYGTEDVDKDKHNEIIKNWFPCALSSESTTFSLGVDEDGNSFELDYKENNTMKRLITVEIDMKVIIESSHITGYLEPSIDHYVGKDTAGLFGDLYD